MNTRGVAVRTGALALVTGLLFSIGAMTVDMSLPAIPAMQNAIGTEAYRAELSLTIVFFGLALSQLLFGAVADRYGRRGPLLLGLVLYCAASLAAWLSPSLYALLAARFAQAVGYGVVIVLIRSAVADVCDERGTARVFSTAITLMSVASVMAPAIGGQLLEHFGWRSVFVAMSIFGAASLLVAAAVLPETLPPERRVHQAFGKVFGSYAALLRNPRFLAFSAVSGFAVAYQFTYNTGGPSLVIGHFAIAPATAGVLFSVIALSTAVASQTNAFLLKWYAPERIMRAAVVVSVVASMALVLFLFSGVGGVVAAVGALFVLISTLGFIAGNAMAAAIAAAGPQAGAASALVGVLQFICGTLSSGLLGLFPDASGRLMAALIAVLSLATLVAATRARSTRGRPVTA